ncbi:ankyrin, partial [Choiromyces venosus 120613-1]
VRLLLSDPKVSVNTAEGSARTALTMAAMNGHEKVVRMLLDHPGINVNVQTQYGDTPLNWAAVNGHVSVVRMLVEDERVDINLENHSSLTPLRSATECSQQGVVRLLLAREGIGICKSNPAINRRKHEWALARKLETRERRKNHRGWARKLPAWVKGWWGRMGKEDESRERECIFYSTSPGESTFDLR